MAALDSLDNVGFESIDWDNEIDWDNKKKVEEFLEDCKIEEDTQSQTEAKPEAEAEAEAEPEAEAEAAPNAKRYKTKEYWDLLQKHVRSGKFSSKKNPFLREVVKIMKTKHVGAIIVADCHSAAYIGTSLNDYVGPNSKNYFLLGQSNNTYSYVYDGTTDKFSRDVLNDLSKLSHPWETLPSLHVIFPHFNEVKKYAINELQRGAEQFGQPLDPDMRAFIESKQLFATNIDAPYVTDLERDGEPGVPELNKYIKLKYLHPSCRCTFGIDENFFGPDKLKWDSGEVLNTVTLATDMVTILVMFGCHRNIDGGHDAFQSHIVPSGQFSRLRKKRKFVVPTLGGQRPKMRTKRRRLRATKRPMFSHSTKRRRKRTVRLFRR